MVWEGCSLRERPWGGGLGAGARSPGTAAQPVVATPPGSKGASLLVRKPKKFVALGCKMEAFGVGDGQHSQQRRLRGVHGSSPASGWDRGRGRRVPALTLSLTLPSLQPPLHWLGMNIVVLFCCIFWPTAGPAGF